MKSTHIYLLSFAFLLVSACNKSSEKSALTRIVFDAGNLHVISSSVNKKLETMSVLYGNAKAYDAALNATGKHVSGEEYTFVTWKYHENPLWYGSKINGELLSIEGINVHSSDVIDYHLEKGTPMPVNNDLLDQKERISYILEYRPSILP